MKLPRPDARLGWLAWAIFAGAICALIWIQPGRRDLASGYFDATAKWWSSEGGIYTAGFKGFLYLPQSFFLFMPFTWPPSDVGNALWRLAGVALLALGTWRAAGLRARDRVGERFAVATLLSLCAAFAATRTGQANLHLAGLMLLAGADLAEARWTRASVFLCLGLAAKPLGVVMLLLAAALYRPMRGRLALGLVLFAALPLAHPDPGYALEQYAHGIEKVLRAGDPGDKPYANLVGLLRVIGADVPHGVRPAIQILAALFTLVVAGLGLARLGAVRGSLVLAALAACYLMIFNARTETNTYVILVPYVALVSASAWVGGARFVFVAGLLACAALGADNYGRAFHAMTSPWLKPLIALCFFGLLVAGVLRGAAGPAESHTAG
jgi:hypothetical protein